MERSDILSGNTFSYIEVFEENKGLVLVTEINDTKYIIFDQYCMNPSCNCDDVFLIFTESENYNSEFSIRLSLKKKRYEILDIYGISRGQVDEIVKQSFKDSEEAMGLLKKRYKEMKEAGKSVLQRDSANNSKIMELPAEKPKRNDPCPCGSGKKYKRCCGV